MTNEMTKETYDKIMKGVNILFSTEVPLDEKQLLLLTDFYFNHRHPSTGLSLIMKSYFRAEYTEEADNHTLTEEIFSFCLSQNIPLIDAIGHFTGLYIFESQVATSFVTQDYDAAMQICTPKITDEQYVAYFEPIMKGFVSSLGAYLLTFNKDNDFYKQLIASTYESVIGDIENRDNISMPLSKHKYTKDLDFDIREILRNEKNILTSFMDNKKKFIHMLNETHFLHHLQNDILELTEDGKIIFGNHSKALTIAYENQKALLSIRKNDKDAALRELQTKLKHLEDYDSPESQKLISFTKQLIAFIKQRKNVKIVPIVILAKELNMSNTVALKYAKQVLSGTFNDLSFKKNFDMIGRIN